MTTDESAVGDDSGPESTDPSSGNEPVNYGQLDEHADVDTDDGAVDDSETDSDAVDNAQPDDSDSGADDNTDEEAADPESISRIQRIRMDPDTLLDAIAYNGQEDIGRKGKAVFSLSPPFDEAVEPTLKHLEDDSTKHEIGDEIRLRPLRFVADGRRVVDQRPTRQLAVEELDVDDPDDAMIEAWIDEAMDTWKAHVRDNLTDSVEIFSPHGMAIASVEYETDTE